MIKTVGIDTDIMISDSLRFILSTVDSNGCLKTPYKVNKILIYFISREFTDTTVSQYSREIINPSLQAAYDLAKKLACDFPTQENIDKLQLIQSEINNSKFTSPFYFKEAIPVASFGGYVDEIIGVQERLTGNLQTYLDSNSQVVEKPGYFYELPPVWLNPDLVPPETVDQVMQDNLLQVYQEDGTDVEGKFIFEWSANGLREGDYFICWNWTPNIAGDSLSSHMMFSLGGDSRMTTSIPTHYTKKDKYKILMEKYLPEMFKNFLSDSDLSPYVLQELNLSVAKGFTFVEDMANQIIDLLDANSIHEQLLPLLSNLFNLRLKSNDPTLWRRQTKKAIGNFKRKGTIAGLRSALSDAGFNLLKLTRMWQVFSKYTYQEHFSKKDISNIFTLSKNVILPIIDENFELWYRSKDSLSWTKLNSDYVDIYLSDDSPPYILSWIGDAAPEPISLQIGDSIRILYQTQEIPEEEQNLDVYVRSLGLMDQRDERNQTYPPKNWNTRVLEEDDPLFDLLIPIRHPIKDKIIWGKVRTEFPYSENIYNMEEYNGSTRDSTNPCDIGKDFIDPCSDCQSSVFNLDVEIEELSNNRITECVKTTEEFVPFHSLLHSINYLGSKNEFIKPPVEEIKALISMSKEEVIISGEAQLIFTRAIKSANLDLVKRNMLAQMNDETGLVTGAGYNLAIRLFAPNLSQESDLQNPDFAGKLSSFDKKNINTTNVSGNPLDNSNLLEILSPSANAGKYSASSVSKNYFEVFSQGLYSVSQPLDKSQFEFRISNKIYSQSSVGVTQKDLFIFSDSNFNFNEIKIISQKDIDDEIATGTAFRIRIIGDVDVFDYTILEILPDSRMILSAPDDSSEFYLNKTNLNWELVGTEGSGESGFVEITRRGLVDLGSPTIDDIRKLAKIGDYILYNENQYKLKSFINSENYKFFIENYNEGDVGGVDIIIYRRIVENCVGQLDYSGLELITSVDYESELLVQNGTNSSGLLTKESRLKENFLILINSDYYSILDIDSNKITLDGPNNDWTTLGTSVDFVIYRFINQPLSIPFSNNPLVPDHSFDQVVRSNNEVIEKEISELSIPYLRNTNIELPVQKETDMKNSSRIANRILNSINSGNEVTDSSSQQESINFNIDYKKEE